MPAPTPERVVEAADAYAREAMLHGTSAKAAKLRNVFKAELMALVESRSAPPRMPSCPEGCRDGDHAEGCVYRPTPLAEHMGVAPMPRPEYVQAVGGHLVERPEQRAATAGVRMGGRSAATIPVHPLEHLHPGESAPGLAEPLVQMPDESEEEFGHRKAAWEAKRVEERKTEAERSTRDEEDRGRRADARRLAVFGSVSRDVPPPIPSADRRAASDARARFVGPTEIGDQHQGLSDPLG